ncbi:MAG TPA: hypothetical protein VG889_18835 [Rhizomicrobium sp.]|nr:hypothetical protein [Rhizomicrobium sp.]
MLQSKIGRNFLFCFLLLNAVLLVPFAYGVLQRPDILSMVLPGKFAPGLAPDLTGNLLVLSVVLLLNALLFVTFGIGGTWHAMWAGLRVSPRKMRWLLHERVGLAADISGVVAAAIQEEEKAEIHYLDQARGLLFTGIVLFAIAVPALCMAYVAAAPDGAPIFERAGQVIPNSQVTADDVVRFAVDQLAALALDIPAIFHLRATPIEINGANLLLGLLVVLYRTLIGLGLILLFVGMRRARALLFNALEVAMPVSEIVAMEPVLQDGHGHSHTVEHVEHVVHRHVHEETPPVIEHHDHRHVEPAHEPEPMQAEPVEEVLAEGDVVEIEDANHVVHHAVVHDHPAPHAHVEHAHEDGEKAA